MDQVIALVKYAIDTGYTEQYSILKVSMATTISRQTLYRWEKDGIFRRVDNKLSIIDLHDALKLIEMRQKG